MKLVNLIVANEFNKLAIKTLDKLVGVKQINEFNYNQNIEGPIYQLNIIINNSK